MNEDTITDLKQFITATVAQQTIDLEQRLDKKLDEKLDQKLDEKLGGGRTPHNPKNDDLSAAVAEAIESSTTETDTRLDDPERRIAKLEHNHA